jgi:hypothetical protein
MISRPTPSPKNGFFHFTKRVSTLIQTILSAIAAIAYAVGYHYVFDPQYWTAGLLILASAITVTLAILFIHWRHTFRDKRVPALGVLIGLAALSTAFLSIGCTSVYFIANKDYSERFFVTVSTTMLTPPVTPQTITPFSAISFLPNDVVVRPINQLTYFQITNNTNVPREIVGISVESGGQWFWWPWTAWTKQCPVNLHNDSLFWSYDLKAAVRLNGRSYLEEQLRGHPLEPNKSAAGWIAFECRKNSQCDSKLVRIGISDAAGSTYWQIIVPPAVEPDLKQAMLDFLPEKVDLTKMPVRTVSSCR